MENFLISLERKPKIPMETDRGEEFHNSNFQKILKKKKIEHDCRNKEKGAVFTEVYDKSIRSFLKKTCFWEKWWYLGWYNTTLTKQFFNRILFSTKSTLIQASSKKNEGYV